MNHRLPQRTCVGCRKTRSRDDLLRIVSSPEGALVPDLKGRLPGRGAYVCGNRSCIQRASRRGALSHALKRPVATGELEALGSKIRESIDRRILSFLGILMKGNKVAAGRETIQKALRKHAVHLLLQAADADIRLSGTPGMEVPVRALFSRERFGQALGKAPQPLLGILDAKGSQALLKMIDMKKEIEQGGGE